MAFEVTEHYRTLKTAVVALWLRRDVVLVSGPDAETYLQGQLSQDIVGLKPGESTWSFLLQPHGKVDAFLRVTRQDESTFYLDVDSGFRDLVIERLRRFLLRTDAVIEALEWKVLAVRGPQADEVRVDGGGHMDNGVRAELHWPGLEGYDVLGEHLAIPDGVLECSSEAYEAVRIEAGFPYMGAEIDEKTIPAELGANDRSISFTKGCYTGQELVARIDARGGNVPRLLRVIVIDGDEEMPRGARIMPVGERGPAKPYGTITSAAWSPGLKKSVALAMIRRGVPLSAKGVIVWDEGPTTCTIERAPVEKAPAKS